MFDAEFIYSVLPKSEKPDNSDIRSFITKIIQF